MSKGLLNPNFNRVRTSNALKSNDMWEKIGVTEERGNNEAIEASIRAPTRGGGDKEARMERAQALITASGYKPVVTDYQGLMNLARAQGGIGNMSRGACKLCGGLGHRTKQCTNFLSGHSGATDNVDIVVGAGMPGAMPLGGGVLLGLLPEPSDISDISSDLESDSGSSGGSSSDEDGGARKRKRSSKDSKKESKDSKRSKGEKKSKHKKESKGSKHKSSKKDTKDRDRKSKHKSSKKDRH